MKNFFKDGMIVNDLMKLCEIAINKGYGNALVQVQADVDCISDITINGIEGFGDEFNNLTLPILSIVSVANKEQFERIYGKVKEIDK